MIVVSKNKKQIAEVNSIEQDRDAIVCFGENVIPIMQVYSERTVLESVMGMCIRAIANSEPIIEFPEQEEAKIEFSNYGYVLTRAERIESETEDERNWTGWDTLNARRAP